MSRALNDLADPFRPLVYELIARCIEAGIMVFVVNTRRTAAEQAQNLANGVSWVVHSKHQDGLAIDLCPYTVYQEVGASKLNWDANDPNWNRMGVIGESLGLRWGGRWKQADLGHFEYVAPVTPKTVTI